MGSAAGTASPPPADRNCPKCGRSFGANLDCCPDDGTKLMDQTLRASIRDDPLLGQVLGGKYKVDEVIGRGGMGIVYAGTHVVLGKRVALKVLRGQFDEEADLIARFTQEARAASAIGSAHIVDVTDFGELPGGSAFFVMEYLAGEPLSSAMKRAGPMPPERVVGIAEQICRALGSAHAHGIVHRDLKPDNVFLLHRDERSDFVKILDFGIAKVAGAAGPRTKSGVVIGTPYYMSPEQASGGTIDGRTDIYALGVILFEMLTGQVPYDGDSFVAILTKHIMSPVPRLSDKHPKSAERPALEQIVARAMAKDPAERPVSMDDLRSALIAAVPAPLTDSQLAAVGPRGTVSGYAATGPLRSVAPVTGATTGIREVRSRGPRIAALIALPLVLLVGIGFFALDRANDPLPIVGSPLPPNAAPIVPGVPPPPLGLGVGPVPPPPIPGLPGTPGTSEVPAPPAPSRTVRVVSDPAGATVWDGEQRLGVTPLDLERGETVRTLVVRADGRVDATVTVGPEVAPELSVSLPPAARVGPRHGAGPKQGSGGRRGGGGGELRDPFGP